MRSFHAAEAEKETVTEQIIEQLIMPEDKVKGSIGLSVYK